MSCLIPRDKIPNLTDGIKAMTKISKFLLLIILMTNLTSCATFVEELRKAQEESQYRKHAWSSYTSMAIADEHCDQQARAKYSSPTLIAGAKMDCMHYLDWY